MWLTNFQKNYFVPSDAALQWSSCGALEDNLRQQFRSESSPPVYISGIHHSGTSILQETIYRHLRNKFPELPEQAQWNGRLEERLPTCKAGSVHKCPCRDTESLQIAAQCKNMIVIFIERESVLQTLASIFLRQKNVGDCEDFLRKEAQLIRSWRNQRDKFMQKYPQRTLCITLEQFAHDPVQTMRCTLGFHDYSPQSEQTAASSKWGPRDHTKLRLWQVKQPISTHVIKDRFAACTPKVQTSIRKIAKLYELS